MPKAAGGSDEEENLWLACRLCNSYKGVQTQGQDPESDRNVKLFNPRLQQWTSHFTWINNDRTNYQELLIEVKEQIRSAICRTESC
jgi:hypothetical protein